MICKNCNQEIADLRTVVKCSVCNAILHKDCRIKEGETFYCDNCYTVKTETPESPYPDLIIPDTIRRSYIETYKSCPYKFYLEVIKGVSEDAGIYAQMGIDLHELFEKACNNHTFTQNDMTKEFATKWNAYPDSMFENTEQKDKLALRSLTCIANFYKVLPTLPYTPFKTEEKIVFDVGKGIPNISTTSDRIDEVDGELEVIDWKTGKTMVGAKFSTDLQAPLYIYGIRNKYKKPIRKFTFYYLNEDKIRIFTRTTNDDYICKVRKREYHINITDAIREVQAMFAKIVNKKFNIPFDTRKMFFTCKMCHLQKNGICKGADLESWKQHQTG